MNERSAGGFELLAADGHSAHPELAHWHGNIGSAVALDLADPPSGSIESFTVLNWNLAIGKAFLDELYIRLRKQISDPAHPFIILAQEAYRSDPSVPDKPLDRFHGGHMPVGFRRDIVDFAHDHNLSLRYAPSMRNGRHKSDRGNAILSSIPFASSRIYTLPYIRQRRAVVKAELAGLPRITFVSAHLDTGGKLPDMPRISAYGAGRAAQATELARRMHELAQEQAVIVGADLNSALGMRDPALRALLREGLEPMTGSTGFRHTFHSGPMRLHLDHVLVRKCDVIRECVVTRLDEIANDRTRLIFGSDHHPLLANVTLAP